MKTNTAGSKGVSLILMIAGAVMTVAALALDFICIQMCVAMVHAARAPDRARLKEQGFRERRLARVDMCEYSQCYFFHVFHYTRKTKKLPHGSRATV